MDKLTEALDSVHSLRNLEVGLLKATVDSELLAKETEYLEIKQTVEQL